MTVYAMGFDPSINDSAWAVVGTDGSIRCGLIRNTYKSPSVKLDNWAKLAAIIPDVQEKLFEVKHRFPSSIWVCEGQYSTRRGSQDHNIRLGWVSAVGYTVGLGSFRIWIAVPTVWTCGVPKELRVPDVLNRVDPESRWVWDGAPCPPSLMHNIYDAVGLALWGLDKYDKECTANSDNCIIDL